MPRPARAAAAGFSLWASTEIVAKPLQLLREVVPTASRIALLTTPAVWDLPPIRSLREVAPRMGVTLIGALPEDPIDAPAFRRAFSAMTEERVDAVIVGEGPTTAVYLQLIVELAAASRLPIIAAFRAYTQRGGLMWYGWDLDEVGRIAADYVIRILQGEKPAEMPIRLIDRYELVVNLKTARALGLTVPPAILARADEVIE